MTHLNYSRWLREHLHPLHANIDDSVRNRIMPWLDFYFQSLCINWQFLLFCVGYMSWRIRRYKLEYIYFYLFYFNTSDSVFPNHSTTNWQKVLDLPIHLFIFTGNSYPGYLLVHYTGMWIHSPLAMQQVDYCNANMLTEENCKNLQVQVIKTIALVWELVGANANPPPAYVPPNMQHQQLLSIWS